MKEFINYLERKIDGCDALGRLEREKAVYQSVLKEYRKAIKVIPCSTQLKDAENNDFKYWYTINKYTKIDDLTFKKGNDIISKTELYKYWRSKINPLIV